jgi:hypothetical protein
MPLLIRHENEFAPPAAHDSLQGNLLWVVKPRGASSGLFNDVEGADHGLVHLVVGTKLQRPQQGRDGPSVVMAVGGAHHRGDMLAIGWAGALKLLHQVGEGLLIDHRKKHFADDPIGVGECRLGQPTQ